MFHGARSFWCSHQIPYVKFTYFFYLQMTLCIAANVKSEKIVSSYFPAETLRAACNRIVPLVLRAPESRAHQHSYRELGSFIPRRGTQHVFSALSSSEESPGALAKNLDSRLALECLGRTSRGEPPDLAPQVDPVIRFCLEYMTHSGYLVSAFPFLPAPSHCL